MSDIETDMIHTGDAFDVLPDLPDESVHACVTDPPYGLAFMGRDWDDFEPREYQEWCEEWAREVKRVLKPGAHMLAFSGNRTHHRLFTGVEDAGFEIRDTVTWHYGNGFPKGGDVGDGFKTSLKPATEYVAVARKPCDETAIKTFQEHGTGALNIDGARIGDADTTVSRDDDSAELGYMGGGSQPSDTGSTEGRYPSNVVFDETEAERLDQEVGELTGGAHTPTSNERNIYSNGDAPSSPDTRQQLDSGGPSRYFYTSKASKAERTLDGTIDNAHPTVKPADLMEWLVTLVTAEGQIVLDPFAGSGTTLRAAKDLGRRFVGIERQSKWADVARVRCGLTPGDPCVVRGDDGQSGMEDWT